MASVASASSGLQINHLRDEQRHATQGLQVGHVLRGHDRAFLDHLGQSTRVDAARPFWADLQATHVVEPIEEIEDIRRRRRFRIASQPSERRPTQVAVDDQQPVERIAFGFGQRLGERHERALAGPRSRREANPLQNRSVRDDDVCSAQPLEHCLHDRLAAVRAPGDLGSYLEGRAPIGQAETSKAQQRLKFDSMLTTGLVAARIFAEKSWIDAELIGDKQEKRLGERRARSQLLPRKAEQAHLNGEAEPVHGAPFRSNPGEVGLVEQVVSGHLGGIDGNCEETGALIGGQQGATRHGGLLR